MPDKIHILHMGAQKTGTTWFWKQLNKQDWWCASWQKEPTLLLDWYNVTEPGGSNEIIQNEEEHTKKQSMEFGLTLDLTYVNRTIQYYRTAGYNMSNPIGWLDSYVEHYGDVLENKVQQETQPTSGNISADLFPVKYQIQQPSLQTIKDKFEEKGIRTVPMFAMRDPVCRLHSMAKMYLKEIASGKQYDNHAEILESLTNPDIVLSGSWTAQEEYETMLHEIDEGRAYDLDLRDVVNNLQDTWGFDDRTCVIYAYEDLFSDDNDERDEVMSRMAHCLGDVVWKDIDWERENSSQNNNKFDRDLHDLTPIYEEYQEDYEFAEELYNETLIAKWDEARENLYE